MTSSTAMIHTNHTEEVAKFLSERYILVSIDEGDYAFYFIDTKKQFCIVVQLYNLSYMKVIYFEYPDVRGINVPQMNFELFENEDTQLDKSILFKQFSEYIEQKY